MSHVHIYLPLTPQLLLSYEQCLYFCMPTQGQRSTVKRILFQKISVEEVRCYWWFWKRGGRSGIYILSLSVSIPKSSEESFFLPLSTKAQHLPHIFSTKHLLSKVLCIPVSKSCTSSQEISVFCIIISVQKLTTPSSMSFVAASTSSCIMKKSLKKPEQGAGDSLLPQSNISAESAE